ncbi:hypothetical protein K438DRAFT_1167620 [Mycena galopus ATCC 62051]|nr:hypothetical protein K438DRAFT_1167620 [Mycena galopus ATCC 62051]
MQYTVDSLQFDSSWDFLVELLSDAGVCLFLYGIYFNLFLLSIYTLSRRQEQKGKRFLIAASCVMAVVGTTQIAIDIAIAVITARVVQQQVQMEASNGPHSVTMLQIAQDFLLGVNNAMTDTLFMYRCYLIWGCRRKVLVLPALLMLCTLLLITWGSFQSTNVTPARIGIGLAVATNLVLTALTAGRIMWIWRQSSHVGLDTAYRSHYGRAIGLILESGAIYSVAGIFLFITASQAEIFDTAESIGQQILNIIPTFTLVYVGLDNMADRGAVARSSQLNHDIHHRLAFRAVQLQEPPRELNMDPEGKASN